MKRIALLLLLAVPSYADVATLVKEGIALYDIGRFDAAIAKFKAALEEDPSSDLAAYELGLTYSAKGDNAQCIALLEARVARKGKYQAPMYAILGNCHDNGGDSDRAIAAYRKGLRINGDDTQLLFNLAVTLRGRGKYDEARKLLKKELTLRPDHPGGYYALALVFEAQNFRMPATLAYLRFLSLESEGERAKDAARRALALLGAGVEQKDDQNVTITIDAKPRKEEGDFAMVEMMMGIAGAALFLPEKKDLSEFEKRRAHVAGALAMIAEAHEGRDFTSKQIVPYFRTLYDRKLLDVYAGVALRSLDLPGEAAWTEANRAAIEGFLK